MTLNKIIDYRNQHPQLWLPRSHAEFEHREVTRYETLVDSWFVDQLRDKSDTSVILRTGGTSSLAYKILPSSPYRFKYNDRAVSKQLLVDVVSHLGPKFVVQLLRYKIAFLPGNMFESGDVSTRYVSNALVSEKWWLGQWVCPVPQEIFDGAWSSETSEQKLSKIAQCYDGRSPAVVSWVPWVVLQFAKQWKKLYDAPLHPQVVIVWWCAIDPYVQQLRDQLWQGVLIIPYYNATEGTFGYQPRDLRDSDDYQTLQLKRDFGVWYELVDDEWQIIDLTEAQLGVHYRLLISTYDGLCRYELGDVIEMIDVVQSWIKIVGRTSEYIDIANEHTQIQHVQQTMSQLCEDYHLWQYCVFPSQDGEVWHYVVVVESSPESNSEYPRGWKSDKNREIIQKNQKNTGKIRQDIVWETHRLNEANGSNKGIFSDLSDSFSDLSVKFDQILWTQNCNYAAKRSGGTLWPVQVKAVEQWWFDDLIAQLNHERQSTQSKLLTLYPREDNPVKNKLVRG